MAFGNISTLYIPTAGNAGSSQWGTDVRKLLDSADAGSDSTTITSHGTGGAVTRTFDPYSTSSADSDQSLFGWAITPSDMGGSSGARRFYPAGNHVLTARFVHNGALTETATLLMYVYRVGTAGASRARTLLGSGSNSLSLGVAATETTGTCTVSLAEVIFEPDQTIQYSFEVTAAGVIITGHTVTLFCGTRSSVVAKIDTPKLGVLADTTGTATGAGDASAVGGKVLNTIGTATGLGDGSGVGASRADTTGAASGSATADGVMSAVAGTIGTADGAGAATGVLGATGAMTGTAAGSGSAAGVLGAIGGMTGSASGSGEALGVLGATGGMTGTSSGSTAVDGQGSSVAGTTGSAAGLGSAAALASIVLGTTGTVEIGAAESSENFVRPVLIFED